MNVLSALKESNFEDTANCIPQPYQSYPELDSSIVVPYDLPLVLVPPEVIEMDSMSTDSGEDVQIKKEEWPEFFVRVFANDVSYFSNNLKTKIHIAALSGISGLQLPTWLCHPNGAVGHYRYL